MYILYQMHVSWFETEMAIETLNTLQKAITNTNLDVKVKLCFNTQTMYETPIEGTTKDMFNNLLEHDIVKSAEITWKTNDDEFYNVGDWRRDCYDTENITVWGECDCYIPITYFAYIESIFNQVTSYPFIITIKQKKMWDDSWTYTEHEVFQDLTLEQVRAINNKFVTGEGFLTEDELNLFNDAFNQKVVLSDNYKGDGALVCLSPNMPTPFIPIGLHMCGEDTYFFNFCRIKKIQLYNISYYLKGHNTNHPLKRVNHTRTDKQKRLFQELDSNMRTLAYDNLKNIQHE